MPIYEFECRKCGQMFEVTKLGKLDASSVLCPGCGNVDQNPRRVLSPCNFHLKGGGWARDGYDRTSEEDKR